MGCVTSKRDINDIHPNIFSVLNVDDQGNKHTQGQLEVTEANLVLYQKGKEPVKWPLKCLRRYGFESNLFSFESGRRCKTGPGIYAFRCQRAEQLFNLLVSRVRNHRDPNSAVSTTTTTTAAAGASVHHRNSTLNSRSTDSLNVNGGGHLEALPPLPPPPMSRSLDLDDLNTQHHHPLYMNWNDLATDPRREYANVGAGVGDIILTDVFSIQANANDVITNLTSTLPPRPPPKPAAAASSSSPLRLNESSTTPTPSPPPPPPPPAPLSQPQKSEVFASDNDNNNVNYIILDLNHTQPNNGDGEEGDGGGGQQVPPNLASSSPSSASIPPQTAAVRSSNLITSEGYATIDFDKTVALIKSANAALDPVDEPGVRKTRHNSTLSSLSSALHNKRNSVISD